MQVADGIQRCLRPKWRLGTVRSKQPLTELFSPFEIHSTVIQYQHRIKWLIRGRCVFAPPPLHVTTTALAWWGIACHMSRAVKRVSYSVRLLHALGVLTEKTHSQKCVSVSLYGIVTPRTKQHRSIESKILGTPSDAARRLSPTLNRAICCSTELHLLTVA